MEEGLIRFMRRWYYFVGVIIALVATMFTVFYPAVAVVMVMVVIAMALFFIYYHYKYELLKKDRHPIRQAKPTTMHVEEVDTEVSQMPDLNEMARMAAAGGPKVKANIVEGSGMDLVERYMPLGEMLFPINFIADREKVKYQEGSLDIGEPLCLWHTVPIWWSHAPVSDGSMAYMVHCPKCPQGGKAHDKSLDDTKKSVEFIATTTLRDGDMPMYDETLMEAIKRGRGELPG